MKNEDDKILLILDLDETLIHATKDKCNFNPDFEVFDYKVIKRPYLDEFISSCQKNFKIAIWSSASDQYVNAIVSHIFSEKVKLEFIWGRSKATYKPMHDLENVGFTDHEDFHYIKRLKKVKPLGFDLKRTLIIDDTPHKSIKNYGNSIYIKEFYGDKSDNELYYLESYLQELKKEDDMRVIEKRNWRKKY